MLDSLLSFSENIFKSLDLGIEFILFMLFRLVLSPESNKNLLLTNWETLSFFLLLLKLFLFSFDERLLFLLELLNLY